MNDGDETGAGRERQVNPMDHPGEQPAGSDGSPRFGRLLVVLGVAVLFVVLLTFLAEYYFSP
jgi:hypothetical protein